ncbi:MAG: aspartate--tRNA ligase [Oscillospiraceae bacterium]|nr:aspartate--tRNA ligase [Oscillospiraceae bacterium]
MQNDTMQGLKRTHYCGALRAEHIGQEVTLCGFVQKNRDKGSIVFVDLRDRSGISQLIFDDATPPELLKKAASVRAEFVLMVKGKVRERASKNPDIPTGDVELFVEDLRILSRAQTPPFEITQGETKVGEELRLKYRYLDLRRGEMQKNLMLRHKIVKATRDFYDRNGFLEVETPILIKSTPEGARDYLVPSRVHPGSFYALPQSPQLFKQLLMLSGYDRYMQIAKCFRDEDLRADRQPEFTQIDLEMSFVDEDDVMAINEAFIADLFEKVLDIKLETPFPRLPYDQAMSRFGSDKPDIRFGLELNDLSGVLTGCSFKVFAGVLGEGGSVRGINVKGGADRLSRKEIDKLTEVVKTYKGGGLAFLRWTDQGQSSSYEKFLTEDEVGAVRAAMQAEEGDVLLIVADKNSDVVFNALGALRLELAAKLDLIEPGSFAPLWVVDFPLFEYDEEDDRYVAKHHPFTAPKPEDAHRLESDPAGVRARAYDMVLNGSEIGGGSIRINDPVLQQRMFTALGMDEATQQERFGFLLGAFEYGVPPHGGLAFGLDRLVMLMAGKSSIRDVIAFPKVQNAGDLMIESPSPVDQKSLDELHIGVNKK